MRSMRFYLSSDLNWTWLELKFVYTYVVHSALDIDVIRQGFVKKSDVTNATYATCNKELV